MTEKNLNTTETEKEELLDELDDLLEELDDKPNKETQSHDEETQSFLDELSDFLDDEEDFDEYDLPDLDDLEKELPTIEEDLKESDELYLEDDEETKEIRSEASKIALGLMNYVEYNVISLENELSALGEAFNTLLDSTKNLDSKISLISEKITKAKLQGKKEALDFIHEEIKLISDNLQGAIESTDPEDKEVLEENIEILFENKTIIEKQIEGLKKVGSKTDDLENNLYILDSSIKKLQAAINSNEVFSIANLIANEISQTVIQISDAQKAEDMQDIEILKENLDILIENRTDIEDKVWDLSNKDVDIEGLNDYLEILNINLEQFSRSIDEAIHSFSFNSNNQNKPRFSKR